MSIRRADLESLLVQLIGIDSRNPWLIPGTPGEGAIGTFLADRLRALGVPVFVDEVEPGRANVVGRWPGSGSGPSLCLNAHLDTVGHAGWPDRALHASIESDRAVGLGAADDKGPIAAVVLALESIVRSGRSLRGDLIVAFTIDEEATSIGTQDLVSRHRTEAAIVVEPFGLGRAIVTHQGFGWLDVVVRGRAAHGSAPDVGIDAISHAALVLKRLDELAATWLADPHPLNGATVYHASTIRGGTDYATYPATCTIGIEIGTQPGETIADRVRDLEAIFESIREQSPDFDAEINVCLDRDPFEAYGHEALWDAAAASTLAVTGRQLEAIGANAWMDSALMQAAGIPTITLGAGGGQLHATDEWVSLSELVSLAEILEATARAYCG